MGLSCYQPHLTDWMSEAGCSWVIPNSLGVGRPADYLMITLAWLSLGLDHSLSWGPSVPCRMFSRAPDPPHQMSIEAHLNNPKLSPDTARCPWRQNYSWWRSTDKKEIQHHSKYLSAGPWNLAKLYSLLDRQGLEKRLIQSSTDNSINCYKVLERLSQCLPSFRCTGTATQQFYQQNLYTVDIHKACPT